MLSLLAGLYSARLAGRHALVRRSGDHARLLEALRHVLRPLCGVAALVSIVVVGTAIVSVTYLDPGRAGGLDRVSMDNPDYRLALALSHINPLDYRALFYIARAEAALATGLGAG